MNWMESLNQLSIFIAIWVAIYGIDSWRREHTGKRQIELAEDTLSLFYESVDVIKSIRHPASFPSETDDIIKEKHETEAQHHARRTASVVFSRYNKNQELFNKLHAMRYRFMAQIGKEQAKPFNDLRDIVNQITLAARMLARLWPKDSFQTQEEKDKHFELIKQHEAVFWDGMSEEDPINPKLEAIISDIENTCQSVISGKGTIHSFLNQKVLKSS